MKQFCRVISILFTLLICVGCANFDIAGLHNEEHELTKTSSITELTNTDYFRDSALEHIFIGEINGKGQAVGFHYEGIEEKKGKVIPGTASIPNDNGVYEAEVMVEDVAKQSNEGKSTFFPLTWSAQEVVEKINDAYDHKEYISGNTYEGLTEEGVIVRMYLDDNDKIISAFPKY